METILDFFGMSKLKSTKRGDDDRVDRLSRNVSVTMLVFFSIVVTTKTFVGEPIHCWVPPRFSGSQEDYINSYCWIRNTYFLDHHMDVPTEDDETPKEEITYYQWVPLILLVQALFFYMPYMLWKSCSNKTGLDLNSIVMAGESFNATETAEVRDKTMGYMTTQMDRYLAESQKDFRKSRTISFKQILACCTCLRGTCLYGFYMFIKVLFLINVLLQFLAINYVFGNGLELIKSSVNETGHVMGSRHFPRATMCDFKVRRLGNNHRTTVQCVLPINHFNEKIFILLWFWFLVVMVITCFSLLTWLVRMFPRSRLDGYAQRHLDYALAAANEMEDENNRSTKKKDVKTFVDYLDRDGIFVMRMLALNADTITATDFLYALYKNFENKGLISKRPRSSDEDKMADKMEDATYKRRAKLLKKK